MIPTAFELSYTLKARIDWDCDKIKKIISDYVPTRKANFILHSKLSNGINFSMDI